MEDSFIFREYRWRWRIFGAGQWGLQPHVHHELDSQGWKLRCRKDGVFWKTRLQIRHRLLWSVSYMIKRIFGSNLRFVLWGTATWGHQKRLSTERRLKRRKPQEGHRERMFGAPQPVETWMTLSARLLLRENNRLGLWGNFSKDAINCMSFALENFFKFCFHPEQLLLSSTFPHV